ncbi:MAG TPA: hypothetical protein VKG43_00850 [Acidimicrobiales bacterium]|nr:hypothetical protein [Acidimicrobiales bacterium]
MTAGTSYRRRENLPPPQPTRRPGPRPPAKTPAPAWHRWAALGLACVVGVLAYVGYRELVAALDAVGPAPAPSTGLQIYGPSWARFQVQWPWRLEEHSGDPALAVVGGARPSVDTVYVAATPDTARFRGTQVPDPLLYVEVRRYHPAQAAAPLAALSAAGTAAGVPVSVQGGWATATWDHAVTYATTGRHPGRIAVEMAEEELVDNGVVYFVRVGTPDLVSSERLLASFRIVVSPSAASPAAT